VSTGDEDSVQIEQRAFLAQHLGGSAPEIVARFALPDDVKLLETDVLLPRPELPRALRVDVPNSIPSVVVTPRAPTPDESSSKPLTVERWITIVPLAYTFYFCAPAAPEALPPARLPATREALPPTRLPAAPASADDDAAALTEEMRAAVRR